MHKVPERALGNPEYSVENFKQRDVSRISHPFRAIKHQDDPREFAQSLCWSPTVRQLKLLYELQVELQ